ncbi:ABC transporter ATP-binding protein [Demequina sediminicola]|uniref:ABC transporter ATP-binding protein n=1 Tax=Demequina sediminicola TaxID=1095026 RepID=UPI000781AD9C|nr:ABC transporter ATP-binding protein [Demequina sediminicola]
MSTAIEVAGLTKHYGQVTAVDDVSFAIPEGKITGLLGRNGAGKTTLMSLLTAQEFATQGTIRVWGEDPVENAAVLSRMCFIKESQVYPDSFKGSHVLRSAQWFFPRWDVELAQELVDLFGVPTNRPVKKMSRGQRSMLGVVIGFASRADVTFFDEPYAGLDAVARKRFYDVLLEQYSESPRTVVLSTHLIDEASHLLEQVLVVHEGSLVIDANVDDLRGSAATLVGRASDVDLFATGRDVLDRSHIGGIASVTIAGLNDADKALAASAGLEVSTVSLQELIVRRTGANPAEEAA